jgi:hypothetical protein
VLSFDKKVSTWVFSFDKKVSTWVLSFAKKSVDLVPGCSVSVQTCFLSTSFQNKSFLPEKHSQEVGVSLTYPGWKFHAWIHCFIPGYESSYPGAKLSLVARGRPQSHLRTQRLTKAIQRNEVTVTSQRVRGQFLKRGQGRNFEPRRNMPRRQHYWPGRNFFL